MLCGAVNEKINDYLSNNNNKYKKWWNLVIILNRHNRHTIIMVFSQHIFGIIIETAPRTIIGGNFVRQFVSCRDFVMLLPFMSNNRLYSSLFLSCIFHFNVTVPGIKFLINIVLVIFVLKVKQVCRSRTNHNKNVAIVSDNWIFTTNISYYLTT